MNHALPIAFRPGGLCLQKAICPRISWTCARLLSSLPRQSTFLRLVKPNVVQPKTPSRHLSSTSKAHFAQSFTRQRLVAYKPTAQEQGLSFQNGDLTTREITTIFGQDAPPTALTNQLLRVLHGRRVDGTLDLPLPKEFTSTLRTYPTAIEDGLQWLRENFPIDEDEAIIQRIEREEAQQSKDNPSAFIRRGEEMGLYKPQSGNYQAPLGEDVFGVSQIEKKQAENVKKAEQEEEELQQEIDKLQEEVHAQRGLAIRPENSLESSDGMRPPNTFEKWILRSKLKATSNATVDDISDKGPWRRLLPSFLFVAFISGLCYLYAVTWIPPKRSERLFPNVGLTFTTITTLIAANFFIYALWKWPPAWRMLNRYFITVPGIPVPLSFVGNVFSHIEFKHVAVNMLWVLFIGLNLHEEVGRGKFLGMYIAGGAIGTLVSASSYVFRGILFTSHLGASGAVWAMLAAFFVLHGDDGMIFLLLPEEWRHTFSVTGFQFLAVMLLKEAAQFASIRYFARYRGTDFAAHFGGYAVGILAGWWFSQDEDTVQRRKGNKRRIWLDHMLGWRGPDDEKRFKSAEE